MKNQRDRDFSRDFSDREDNLTPRKCLLDIVINPATGAGHGKKISEKIKTALDQTGEPYKFHYSSPQKSVDTIVRELTDGKTSDIIIVGGDGSMNEAVNGIQDFSGTRLGFVPAGSANDLARDLGMKGRSLEGSSPGTSERTVDMGVIQVNGSRRLFNISAGIGFDAETCFFADRSPAKGVLNRVGLGKLIYIATALRLILKNRKFRCTIKTEDGKTRIYDECLFAVGMNRRYEGGGFMFCPDASDTDGMLDFCVVNGVGALKFMRMFPTALSGKHVRFKEIEIFRAKEAVITTETPEYIHADGEAAKGVSSIKLSVFGEKLRMIM